MRRLLSRIRARARRAAQQRQRRRLEQRAAALPAPEVRETRTHYGPQLDAIVARARRRQLPAGLDPDYDLVRDSFDHYRFLLQATHFHERPQVDPIRHFLDNGVNALNSPDPRFGMNAYLSRHPGRAQEGRSPYLAWLAEGRAAGEIADPAFGIEKVAKVLGMKPAKLADLLVEKRVSLSERMASGTLGEMFAKAEAIEPLIGDAWIETATPRIEPLVAPVVADQMIALRNAHRQADFRTARLVLVINRPRWGGGRRVEGHLSYALAQAGVPAEEIVVVYTDNPGETPPGRYPDGVREVHLYDAVAGLQPQFSERTLIELIRSFQAEAVVNINSKLFHEALLSYGRALTTSERVFLVFFNNEQRAAGNWVGYPLRYFYRLFETVTGVITDSDALRQWFIDEYVVPDSEQGRLHVFSAPVQTDLPLADPSRRPEPAPGTTRRPQVFWAGRWDRQKRLDVVAEITRQMPEVDFRLWGEPVLSGIEMPDLPPNVALQGRYERFADLPLDEADAWLYTSAWDGVPSQLLEVGMTGIPMVGSLVGGTGEILLEGLSWRVPDVGDAAAYVAALREVLGDLAEARRRGLELRDRLIADRTQQAYAENAMAVLFGEEASDE